MEFGLLASMEHPEEALAAADSYLQNAAVKRIEFAERRLSPDHEFELDVWYEKDIETPAGIFGFSQAHILQEGDLELQVKAILEGDEKVTQVDPYSRTPFKVGDIVLRTCRDMSEREDPSFWLVMLLDNYNEINSTNFSIKQDAPETAMLETAA